MSPLYKIEFSKLELSTLNLTLVYALLTLGTTLLAFSISYFPLLLHFCSNVHCCLLPLSSKPRSALESVLVTCFRLSRISLNLTLGEARRFDFYPPDSTVCNSAA